MTSIRATGPAAFQQIIQQLTERSRRSLQQLGSQRRIATAADDPAGLAIANRLASAARSDAQGERNLAEGQSLARTAEGALQQSQDALSRMRELSVQAQNGTLSAADRATVQAEFDQVAAQLDQTARGTTFGGRTLLDGSNAGSGAIDLSDGRSTTRLEIGDAGAAALGVDSLDVGDPNTLRAIDAAQASLASERGRLGSVDQALARQQENLATTRANTEEARSRIEDLDVARAVAEHTRDRILLDLQVAGQRIADRNHGRLLDLLG